MSWVKNVLVGLIVLVIPAQSFWFGPFGRDKDRIELDGGGAPYEPLQELRPEDEYRVVILRNWDMSMVWENMSLPRAAHALKLSNCNLSDVPPEITGMVNLQHLSLDHNNLTKYEGIAPMNLERLNLSSNHLEVYNASIPTLKSLDLSSNLLSGIPDSVYSTSLTAFFISNNRFTIDTVTIAQFDFFAALLDFDADFDQPDSCPPSSKLRILKGFRVCRQKYQFPSATPTDPPMTKPPKTDPPNPVTPVPTTTHSTPSASPTEPIPTSSPTVVLPSITPTISSGENNSSSGSPGKSGGSSSHVGRATFVTVLIIAIILGVLVAIGAYVVAARRQQIMMRSALHEEIPLFFDSADRATYRTELTAGDRLFPSHDPVLVIWRIDYDSVKLVSKIAKGAFGEVWLGRHRGSKVAVKRLLSNSLEASEDFVKEVKLMAYLDHPKIVGFIGVAWTRLVDMIAVTEYMDLGDLRSLLEKHPELTWQDCKLQYAIDAIDALVYLHSLSTPIIHRDLKSRNLLIDSKKGAKLGDFGVSTAKLSDNLTGNVGTKRWLAPELARGETDYTEAVDIYAFGVLLSELDTHQLPFESERDSNWESLSDFAILRGIADGSLRPNFTSTCPQQIRHLAERCMSQEPRHRPRASEVAFLLRQRDLLLS